jgi:hypothetical protein
MQPQGLEALMQSQPMPQMDNPRLAAAMDVVTSDAEEQILDPRTLAMLKYKDALQAMQAADQMMASAQPAPTAPTVAERTKLAAEQGIAGLAQRLAPGIQQQGGQMAAQQAQQAMQGGLPQLAAPNMTRMAGGGIVAFAPGGEVEPEDSSQEGGVPTLSEVLALLGAGGRGGERLLRSPITLMEKAGEYGPTLGELASAVAAGYKGEAPPKIPGMLERRSAESSPTTAPVDNNMPPAPRVTPSGATNMPGGVANAVRAQPDLNVGIAAPAANTALDQLRARVEEGAGSEGAGKRFRELTGVDDVIEQRRVEQERLRELQESRFSPEQERGRLLRAALASGAQRGLGGFGIGYAAEEERIANERQTLQQQVVADMDKTISELRALGVGQFEAEQAAQQIHSAEIRDLAKLDQDTAIAKMEAELRREGYSAEQRAAQIKAVNDYALRMQMTPKDVYALASDVLSSALPGTMTFAQALEQVSASLDEVAPSVITNIRPAE